VVFSVVFFAAGFLVTAGLLAAGFAGVVAVTVAFSASACIGLIFDMVISLINGINSLYRLF